MRRFNGQDAGTVVAWASGPDRTGPVRPSACSVLLARPVPGDSDYTYAPVVLLKKGLPCCRRAQIGLGPITVRGPGSLNDDGGQAQDVSGFRPET